MSINLSKNQVIDLKKNPDNTENNLSEMTIGLGWDIKRGEGDYDLDACALLLTNDKLSSDNDVVSYQKKMHESRTIWSNGDNVTGEGDGDDEQLTVKLNSIPEKYNKIVFYATIYQGRSRGQEFAKVQNAYIRSVDAKGKEIARYNISGCDSGMRSLVFAEATRTNTGWEFKAIGNTYSTDNLSDIADMFKGGSSIDLSKGDQPRKKLFGLF